MMQGSIITFCKWFLKVALCSCRSAGFRICFPSDAVVRKVTASGAIVSVRMDELVIGDTVECLKPTLSEDKLVSTFTAGTCDVFYYINAKHVSTSRFLGSGH
jgi:hypothetical protein